MGGGNEGLCEEVCGELSEYESDVAGDWVKLEVGVEFAAASAAFDSAQRVLNVAVWFPVW